MASANTKNGQLLTKKDILKVMGSWVKIEACCSCHPHGDEDPCDRSCKKKCVQVQAYKDVLLLSMALMAYLEYAISHQHCGSTPGAPKGNPTTRSGKRKKGK